MIVMLLHALLNIVLNKMIIKGLLPELIHSGSLLRKYVLRLVKTTLYRNCFSGKVFTDMKKIPTQRIKDSCVKRVISLSLIISLYLFISSSLAQPSKTTPEQELAGELSLADLFNMKITSASLRPQELREVPATTYIITEQDFKMYGYRDLK